LKKSTIRSISNFAVDLEDSENLYYLLRTLAPTSVNKELIENDDWNKRALSILGACKSLGCCPLISPRVIVEAESEALCQVFLADLFRIKHGLPPYTPVKSKELEKEKPGAGNDLNSQGDEESIFAWVKKLGISAKAEKIPDDFKDGVVFLQIISKIPDGEKLIDPKRMASNPGVSIFKRAELCSYVVTLLPKLSLAQNKASYRIRWKYCRWKCSTNYSFVETSEEYINR